MATLSTKGLKLSVTKATATAITLTPTAVSSAKPAEITVTNSLSNGDIVFVTKTGFPEIDGKYFPVGNASGTSFDLIGSDTAASTGSLDATPSALAYAASDFQEVCASSITVDNNTPGTVSVATFCDLTGTIPSVVTELGNMTLSVYHDVTSEGFKLLDVAAENGDSRIVKIVFPNDSGVMIVPGTFSSFALVDIPLDGAAAWEGVLAMSTAPKLRY